MMPAPASEAEFLKMVLAEVPQDPRLGVGIGDDCAAVKIGRLHYQLLKTDCVVEGVHFLRSHRPEAVGHKALARAISDIAAMGGTPKHALITLASPKDLPLAYWRAFYRGLSRTARHFSVQIVGGETSRSPGPIFISVALTGEIRGRKPILRSGGKAGDLLYVTGRLGGTLAGHHLKFCPRVPEALGLVKRFPVHAMMDLSDGLGADLPRLAEASRVGFTINTEAIPCRKGVDISGALNDGEDYELLFSLASKWDTSLRNWWKQTFPKTPLSCIGNLIKAKKTSHLLGSGYDHFRLK